MTTIAERLADAVSEGRLTTVYQPQVAIETGQIVSMEALCRWTDAVLGPVPPDRFIPVAEETGLIVAVGRQMFRQVLHDLPSLLRIWPDLRVGINFSVRELSEPDFPTWIAQTLSQQPSPMGRHLEIEGGGAAAAPVHVHAPVHLHAQATGLEAVDAHHIGAEIGQQRGAHRHRADTRQFDHAQACERSHLQLSWG